MSRASQSCSPFSGWPPQERDRSQMSFEIPQCRVPDHRLSVAGTRAWLS